MTDKRASGVSACAAYRSDAAVIGLAHDLATKHVRAVHVGKFVNEDTGATSPAFFLGRKVIAARSGH